MPAQLDACVGYLRKWLSVAHSLDRLLKTKVFLKVYASALETERDKLHNSIYNFDYHGAKVWFQEQKARHPSVMSARDLHKIARQLGIKMKKGRSKQALLALIDEARLG